MYKYLISFIIVVFVVALFMGRCDDRYDEYDDEQKVLEAENDTQKGLSGDYPSSSHLSADSGQSSSQEDTRISGLEIPKLQKAMSEQIVSRKGYTVSYNISSKNPNWVAWKLMREHTTGNVPRYRGYLNDYDIKGYQPHEEDWQAMPQNLSHGHMCPAGDNKWDAIAMEQTFLLSNMCPQTKKLNSGSWNKLEEKCREWANRYGSIYIVCGPVFNSERPDTMGKSNIWIPDAFYKVVLCMEGGTKAIGFIYANDDAPHSMQQSVRTVDEIEALTGIDFFCSLPDDIENSVEAVANFNKW